MLRKITAVLVGFLVSWEIEIILVRFGAEFIPHDLVLNQWILPRLPVFFGGVIAGYIAQRKGWLFGLLSSILFLVSLFIFPVWSLPWFSVFESPIEQSNEWIYMAIILVIAAVIHILILLVGAAGGQLGQHLAQIWHKRPHQKM